MHAAFLNMEHEKMSKSLGNFFTTREVLDQLGRERGAEQLRFFFMRAHYRNEVDYTRESLEDAGNALRGFYVTLRDVPPAHLEIDWNDSFASRFRDALNDDFDTPIAFAVLHELRTEINRSKSSPLAGLLKALGSTIGLFQSDPMRFLKGASTAHAHVPSGGIVAGGSADVQADYSDATIERMVQERNAARQAGDFPRADGIRRALEASGVILEDKPDGITQWRRK
jgi:cysteinyl-tRNA synthetase